VGVGVGDGVGCWVGVGVGDGVGCWVGVSPVEDGVEDGVGIEDEVAFFSINKSTTIAATEAASSPIIILDFLSMTNDFFFKI
jgi:hypothetical protein